MALRADAFEDDCTLAAVVISAREAPPKCAAIAIDRDVWRTNGAIALRWTGRGFEQSAARPAGYGRPWAQRAHATGAATPAKTGSRDATPQPDNLEAGD